MPRKNSKGGHKRRGESFPGLKKDLHPRNRWEHLDQDYIGSLSKEDKEWLSRFNEEYIGGTFEKTKKGNYSKNNLHKGAKARQECYKRNNDRNLTDTVGIMNTTGRMENIEDHSASLEKSNILHEDIIIDLLDMKDNQIKKLLKLKQQHEVVILEMKQRHKAELLALKKMQQAELISTNGETTKHSKKKPKKL